MTLGYARTSTPEQSLDSQIDALKKAGCEHIFTDQVSGAKTVRPGLDEMLGKLRKGDTIVVWRLDRLGRNLKHLIQLLDDFTEQGIEFVSITEGIDTKTPMGKLNFHMVGALAEFYRNINRENTLAGLASSARKGRKGGRPKGLSKKAEQTSRIAASLYQEDQLSAAQISEQLNISKSTLYRYLRARGVKIG